MILLVWWIMKVICLGVIFEVVMIRLFLFLWLLLLVMIIILLCLKVWIVLVIWVWDMGCFLVVDSLRKLFGVILLLVVMVILWVIFCDI